MDIPRDKQSCANCGLWDKTYDFCKDYKRVLSVSRGGTTNSFCLPENNWCPSWRRV